MHKTVAVQSISFSVTPTAIETPSLNFPDVTSFLERPSFSVIEGTVKLGSERIPIRYRIPNLDIPINPNTVQVEAQVWDHCQQFGLYVGKEKAVKASKFAYLPGLTDPTLSYLALKSIVNGFIDLFGHDDDIDEGSYDSRRLKETNEKFIRAAITHLEQPDDPGKVRGYAQAMKEFFSAKLGAGNLRFFIGTLTKYLQSTEIETKDIEETIAALSDSKSENYVPATRVSYGDYVENRRDTSGIFHAIQMIWSAHQLDVDHLFDSHILLTKMYNFACDSVCRLNDIASANKELDEFQALSRKLSIPLKDLITSNSVLLKWRDGQDLKAAVIDTVSEYDEIINRFMKYASRLQADVAKDPQLQMAVNVLFGLVVGHGKWAGLSKRYDLELTTPFTY